MPFRGFSAFLFLAGFAAAQTPPPWKDKPVLDTSKSAFAVLHGVPVSAVTVREGFWSARRKAAISTSLPTFLALLEQNGEIDNFRRLSGRKNVARRGRIPTDADVYKWLEAVAFAVASGDVSAQVRKAAEGVIDDIAAGQDSTGYMVSAFMGENTAQRHTGMARNHELYIFGHMLQAGIAWYRASGDRKLLDVGIHMADYLLRNFGIDKKPIFEGHPEVELALVELYRTVGDRRYLDLAGYFLNGDPRNLPAVRPADLVYLFTVEPFTDRTGLEGHAVRAMYAVSGATDYYLETGDRKYWTTLTNLWEDMVRHKMYITGGLGSRSQGEAFGDPYELPNRQAYAESCAAIGNVFWNWRLLQATGDAKYTDVLERALYNGANSGLSLDGRLYCYRNPLEVGGDPNDKIRNPWYSTPCCPPNLERILASLPGYLYSTSKDGVWVHLFDNSEMKWKLEDGTPVTVAQQTRYPWDGKVAITVTPAAAKEFTLFVRKPSWSSANRLEVSGAAV
ncbi:MAG TPA: beta-L-arabinofuranosidase domain-containing protein, partial [Bryobacteraceae bacterium]